MSYSVHINGGTRPNMRNSIRLHVIRNDEKTGEEAKKRSGSEINPKLSHYNVLLDDDPDRMQLMRKKMDAISKQRQDRGARKLRSNCEVFGKGTIQLSDDTLAKLGWQFTEDGDKKPVNEQTERAIKNVKWVYKQLYDSMKKQPEIYGDVFCASIHFDEGSPHVDFLTDPIKVENEQTLRDIKAGKRADGKTIKLVGMQDDLAKYAGFDRTLRNGQTYAEAFDLRRGDTGAKKKDLAVNTRKTEKRLKTANKRLQGVNKQVEARTQTKADLDSQITSLKNELKSTKALKEWQDSLEAREKAVEENKKKATKDIQSMLAFARTEVSGDRKSLRYRLAELDDLNKQLQQAEGVDDFDKKVRSIHNTAGSLSV